MIKNTLKVFFDAFLLVLFPLALMAEEKGGFELPEVTIMGKDVSEFESPGAFNPMTQEGKKGQVQSLEYPRKLQEQKRSSFRNISASAGRYGTVTTGLDWAGSHEDLDYLLQFKYARTDGYRDHGSEDSIRPSGSLGLQLKDTVRWTGEFGYFRKRMELPGRIEAPTNLATRENQSEDFQTGLELYPFQGQRLTASLFGTFSRTDEDPLEQSFDDRFLGFSSSVTYGALKGGFELWTERLHDFYSYQKVSGYAGGSGLEIFDDLILESLLQLDYYEGMTLRLDPRVTLTWFATDRFSASLGVHRDLKVRSWSESYLTEYYVEGNLNEIRPERGLEEELTLSYLLREGWTTSLSLFRREVKDLFIWEDLDGNGLYTLGNHPKALIQGLRLDLQAKIFNSWTANSRFTLQEVEGKASGRGEVPYVPEMKLEAGLEWKGPYGLGLGTGLSYTSTQSIDTAGTGEINDYVLWDVMASYEWRAATFFAKVLNVLDQRYDFFAGYPGPDTQYQFGVNLEF